MAQCADHLSDSLGIIFVLVFVEFQVVVLRSVDFQHTKFRLTIVCAH